MIIEIVDLAIILMVDLSIAFSMFTRPAILWGESGEIHRENLDHWSPFLGLVNDGN